MVPALNTRAYVRAFSPVKMLHGYCRVCSKTRIYYVPIVILGIHLDVQAIFNNFPVRI